WFPLTFRDPDERWTGVNKAAPILASFLDAELKRRDLPPSALALVGFSQGTMMALHVGLRRAAAPFALVGYSGLLALPPDANPEKPRAGGHAPPPGLAGARPPRPSAPAAGTVPCLQRARRARRPGRMAHVLRHRPRYRSGRAAPRR